MTHTSAIIVLVFNPSVHVEIIETLYSDKEHEFRLL